MNNETSHSKQTVMHIKEQLIDSRFRHYIFVNESMVLNDILIANHINKRQGINYAAIARRIYSALGEEAELFEVELSDEDQIAAENFGLSISDTLSVARLKLALSEKKATPALIELMKFKKR